MIIHSDKALVYFSATNAMQFCMENTWLTTGSLSVWGTTTRNTVSNVMNARNLLLEKFFK